jgi:thiamine-phosphate pyrophosphorylase
MGNRNSKVADGSAIALIRFAGRLKRGRPMPSLWLMTSDGPEDQARAAMMRLPAGSGVIFRHYDSSDRAGLAARLRRVAAERRLIFLVAGDIRLAVRIAADGFHAPEWAAHRIAAARRDLSRAIVTMAAHGPKGLCSAHRHGAHAVIVSPVFPTGSHPGAETLGPVRLAALTSQSKLPVIALGGIDGDNVRRLSGTPVLGIAAISGLMG